MVPLAECEMCTYSHYKGKYGSKKKEILKYFFIIYIKTPWGHYNCVIHI